VIRFEANLNKKGVASMNELGLFTLALGLTEPWRVSDIKFSKEYNGFVVSDQNVSQFKVYLLTI